MQLRQGFTLIEMMVTLTVIGIVVAFALPNFTNPSEQARASSAQNNLLAIYSAEQNYFNNYGIYPFVYINSLGNTVNTKLGLNIQYDGTYNYICRAIVLTSYFDQCTATRSPSGDLTLTLVSNKPIQLNQSKPNPNPICTPSGSVWCP